MRIISAKGEFFAPALSAQLNINNVLLLEAGEMTSPITLPGTAHNLALIDNSHRPDAYFKPLTDLDVILIDGLVHCKCNLGIHSANEEDGISCTLYLDTGGFYSRLNDMKLAGLNWPILKCPNFDTTTLNDRRQWLIDIMESQYNNQSSDYPFRVVPVETSQNCSYNNETGVTIDNEFLALNQLAEYATIIEGNESVHVCRIEHLRGSAPISIKVDSNNITIDKGYGITPFLKLDYILNFIFSELGYVYDKSKMSLYVKEYYEKTLLYNNVADAIYSGKLTYSQLFPDITIKDFLSETQKVLAGKFIVTENLKKIEFVSFSTAFNLPPDIDLSRYLCQKAKMKDTEFAKILISDSTQSTSDTSSTSTTKTETISFNILKQNYCQHRIAATTVPQSVLFSQVKSDSVVHLNSSLKIGDSITQEASKIPTEVFFISMDDKWEVMSDTTHTNAVFYYRTSYGVFDGSIALLNYSYREYRDFRSNSNIPISAKMRIPKALLESIRPQIPKLLNGQSVMIESMQLVLGDSTTQDVNFRTIRSYADR